MTKSIAEIMPLVVTEPIVPKKRSFVQHNLISRSPTVLSLTQGKIIRYALSYAQECWKRNPDQVYFTLKLSDLTNFLGEMPVEYLPKFKELSKVIVDWNLLPQKTEPGEIVHFDLTPIFIKIKHSTDKNGDQLMTYGFPPELHRLFMKPNFYRIFQLKVIKKFKGKYSLQLYNYLASCLPRNKKAVYTELLSPEKLRALLGCQDSYPDPKSFHQHVINPALTEIEALTEIRAQYFYDQHQGVQRYYFFVFWRRDEERERRMELAKTMRILRNEEKAEEFLAKFVPPGHEVHENEKEFFRALQFQVEEKYVKENPDASRWTEWSEWFVGYPCRLTTYKGTAFFVCCQQVQMIYIHRNYRALVYSIAESLGIPSVWFKLHDPRDNKKPATRAPHKHKPLKNCIVLD
jgi:hypothetical protein